MKVNSKEEALKLIKGQLEKGYIDFSSTYDETEIEIIKSAIELYKIFCNGILVGEAGKEAVAPIGIMKELKRILRTLKTMLELLLPIIALVVVTVIGYYMPILLMISLFVCLIILFIVIYITEGEE